MQYQLIDRSYTFRKMDTYATVNSKVEEIQINSTNIKMPLECVMFIKTPIGQGVSSDLKSNPSSICNTFFQ